MIYFRHNTENLLRGTLSSKAYARGQKRSLVSLKICCVGWFVETLGNIAFISIPLQRYLNFHYFHIIDSTLMFLITPVIYLANDEETKKLIADRDWKTGVQYMLGQKIKVMPLHPA